MVKSGKWLVALKRLFPCRETAIFQIKSISAIDAFYYIWIDVRVLVDHILIFYIGPFAIVIFDILPIEILTFHTDWL